MNRRTTLSALLVAAIAGGCGFRLRGAQAMPFDTIAVTPENGAGVAADLARYFGESVRPLVPAPGGQAPDVILDVLQEFREKVVVGVNSSGLVREFQLRLRLTFRLRTPQGRELLGPTQIEQQREISFNESAVLAKEAEEVLLYRDMQADIVQQVVRRLAAVKRPDRAP